MRTALVIALISASLFAVFGFLGYIWRNSWDESLAIGAGIGILGFFIGLVAAPSLMPEKFRYPVLWEMGASIVAACLIAALFSAPPEGYGVAILLGAIIGYLAPYWIKHIQLP